MPPSTQGPLGRQDPEEVFLELLPWIRNTLRAVADRAGFDEAEEEDFAAWSMLRLIDRDYEAFRVFQGRSSWYGYLEVLIRNLVADYRNRHWGRFVSSRRAIALGAPAIRLEQLVARDGWGHREAIAITAQEFRHAATPPGLEAALEQLPPRIVERSFTDDLDGLATDRDPERDLLEHERAARAEELRDLLDAALEALPARDVLLIRLHYGEGKSLAAIARTLNWEQRPLYRHRDRCLRRLREAFEERGVTWGDVVRVLEGPWRPEEGSA